MEFQQLLFDGRDKIQELIASKHFAPDKANLVLGFGQRTLLEKTTPFSKMRKLYPNAEIILCSSSGQISNHCTIPDDIVVTAINLEKTIIKTTCIDIVSNDSIVDLGTKIKNDLLQEDIKSILILSEGSHINGTELINELIKQTDSKISIFGGLAGDEFSFEKTIVGLNADASAGMIVAVGFYGENIHFGYSSEGGWSDFGPEREVTLSDKNILYKIGDRYALDLYKEYLGKYAEELPGSSLYFPLSMKETENSTPVVRTILSINEENKSMTFAGNIPEGSLVRLMKGNLDKLIDASSTAAHKIKNKSDSQKQIALLISCVGRRIVLGDRVEEELEVIRETFGSNTLLCGFYSYGEISPLLDNVACELHNQTMTITTMFEE
ncbi:FIST signal transduction protein [Flavobacterium sp. 25HG05S-40]|uniref:FIST signal transduction protein n=1 Tax=Flavobacterium sp. 25HG05S-40 TaxID=3458682 RepID=UPI004044EADA